MPTFRVKLLARNRSENGGGTREITTQIAGCVDETVARIKTRQLYDVVTFYWVKPIEEVLPLPKVGKPKLSEMDGGLEM
jgi:hypothetical protein